MNDVLGSSARALAAASDIRTLFCRRLADAAQRYDRAIVAGLIAVFRIDPGVAGSKLFGYRGQRTPPIADLDKHGWRVFAGIRLELGEIHVGDPGELHPFGPYAREHRAGDRGFA